MLSCLAILSAKANAQDRPARLEVGAGVTMASITFDRHATGVSVLADVNVARPLALEVRVTRYGYDPTLGARNGWHLATGVRATFVRRPRFSFYGLAMPGLYHHDKVGPYTSVQYSLNGEEFRTSTGHPAPPTHFVLDLGAGLNFALSSRVGARVEVDRDLHAQRGTLFTFTEPSGSSQYVLTSPIGSRWNVQAGLSVGMGSGPRAQSAARPRWTVGPMAGFTVVTNAATVGTLGAVVSYGWLKHCDIEASVSSTVHKAVEPLPFQGGRVLHALAGLKMGTREGRIGVFFKARAGLRSDSQVLALELPLVYIHRTFPAIEIGGVVEFSASSHSVLRVDLGEALSFVQAIAVDSEGVRQRINYREEFYSLPLQIGFGFRF